MRQTFLDDPRKTLAVFRNSSGRSDVSDLTRVGVSKWEISSIEAHYIVRTNRADDDIAREDSCAAC